MYERIVVGTDGSDRAQLAVDHAAALARTTGATLHLVMGCAGPIVGHSPMDGLPGVDPVALLAAAQARLDELAESLGDDDLTVDSHAIAADGHTALVRVATELGADLIVVGNRGMTGAARMLGSVPNTVSHRAPCSVLIVATDD